MPRSVAATKLGGVVSVIGGVSGFGGPDLGLLSLIGGIRRLHGIMVGSRSMLDEVVQLFDRKQLRPIVDRVFAFDEAPAAYAHLQSGQHFGKIVIRVAQ